MFNKDSVGGTFFIAGGLCLLASLLVSVAAVSLKPIQEKNMALDRKKNILMAAGLFESDDSIDRVYKERITAKVVDLKTGKYTSDIAAETYDAGAAAKDPQTQVKISEDQDLARIRVRAPYKVVYEIRSPSGDLDMVVLPIHGKGLWSTLYGFVALDKDANTVRGLGFYDHKETPGLGGEVDNPKWKALWPGKKIYGDNGEVEIEVIKGQVDASRPQATYQVDGLSGATITSRGVGALLHYWLGDQGFKPYLQSLRTKHSS